MSLEKILVEQYPAPNPQARQQAKTRQQQLTKPSGSLGILERLVVQLAEQTGEVYPQARPTEVLLFAADHPVTEFSVSPYPSAVTEAMIKNFLQGGAAASVISKHLDLPLSVIDVGVGCKPNHFTCEPTLLGNRRTFWQAPRAGVVGNLANSDAMDLNAASKAISAGIEAVNRLDPSTRWIILGEMGIGNTTVASALCAAILGGEAELWVGPGTGADSSIMANKQDVVRRAVQRVGHVPADEALRRLGGREIVALVGAAHAAAARGISILVDGFIVSAAMLALTKIRPDARRFMYFAHSSAEPGHKKLLAALSATPLLDLGMRLGEGSGALTAFPLIETACKLHQQMATFEEATVPEKNT